jgi:argininosuccinate lyase
MTRSMIEKIQINENILNDPKYDLIFSVEEVNRLTLEGVPFRDAYKQVGLAIEEGKFTPNKTVNHTHEGSIGNLCNDQISKLEEDIIAGFGFEKFEKAQNELLNK